MRTAALALALLLAGCGFRPAGSRPLPEALQAVHIDVVAPYRVSEPPLETSLRALLQRRGARILDDASGGTASVLKLSALEERREVLSVGTDGKVLEFQLITSVRFELHRGGQVLVPPDQLTVTRDFSFRPQQVLAKEAEEAQLRAFIQNELAELLMLRIEARLNAPPPPAQAEPAQVVPAGAR